jgi:hypothetical protein
VWPAPFLLTALLWVAHSARADIDITGEVASYSGPISVGLNREFFTAATGKPVKRLVITSGGGEVEAAIALGSWVFERRIDIEVPEYCLSSCANYVFPAGQHKRIGAGAIVAWHGNYHHLKQTGLWQDDIAVRMERYGEDAATARAHVLEEVEHLVRLERDFFARINVDEYLCWIGKMPPYNAPNYYFLSSPDMARFGVTQVKSPPGYESTDVSGFDDHIMYIRLGESASKEVGNE